MFNCFVFRKRSPKSEDDDFTFPDVSASNKCDFETLTRTAQAQKITSSVPVAQQHIFAEPKPKVSNFHCIHRERKKKHTKKNEQIMIFMRTIFDSNSISMSCSFAVKNATTFEIHSCRF